MSRTQVVLLVDYLILNHIGGSYSFVYRQDGLLFLFTRTETRDAVTAFLALDTDLRTQPEGDLALFVSDQS